MIIPQRFGEKLFYKQVTQVFLTGQSEFLSLLVSDYRYEGGFSTVVKNKISERN
jgi:hypothetical protein